MIPIGHTLSGIFSMIIVKIASSEGEGERGSAAGSAGVARKKPPAPHGWSEEALSRKMWMPIFFSEISTGRRRLELTPASSQDMSIVKVPLAAGKTMLITLIWGVWYLDSRECPYSDFG